VHGRTQRPAAPVALAALVALVAVALPAVPVPAGRPTPDRHPVALVAHRPAARTAGEAAAEVRLRQARVLALRGAQVLCVPSAFTAYTGAAHWEILLRARAIENGCFVIAPDQVGEHLPGRDCFGHSMIVDPWGTVLARVDEGVGVCVADLDLGRLHEVRSSIPALDHRRPDLYDR